MIEARIFITPEMDGEFMAVCKEHGKTPSTVAIKHVVGLFDKATPRTTISAYLTAWRDYRKGLAKPSWKQMYLDLAQTVENELEGMGNFITTPDHPLMPYLDNLHDALASYQEMKDDGGELAGSIGEPLQDGDTEGDASA